MIDSKIYFYKYKFYEKNTYFKFWKIRKYEKKNWKIAKIKIINKQIPVPGLEPGPRERQNFKSCMSTNSIIRV